MTRNSSIFLLVLVFGVAACSSAPTPGPNGPASPAGDGSAVARGEVGDEQAASVERASATESTESTETTAATTAPGDPGAPATQASTGPAVAAAPGSKEELLQRVRSMLEQFITAVESNEGDCDAMADSLAVVVDGNRDLGDQMKAIENDPEAKAWFDEQGKAMMEEVMPRMMAVFQAAQACEGNPKMQKVMEDFSSLGS